MAPHFLLRSYIQRKAASGAFLRRDTNDILPCRQSEGTAIGGRKISPKDILRHILIISRKQFDPNCVFRPQIGFDFDYLPLRYPYVSCFAGVSSCSAGFDNDGIIKKAGLKNRSEMVSYRYDSSDDNKRCYRDTDDF